MVGRNREKGVLTVMVEGYKLLVVPETNVESAGQGDKPSVWPMTRDEFTEVVQDVLNEVNNTARGQNQRYVLQVARKAAADRCEHFAERLEEGGESFFQCLEHLAQVVSQDLDNDEAEESVPGLPICP